MTDHAPSATLRISEIRDSVRRGARYLANSRKRIVLSVCGSVAVSLAILPIVVLIKGLLDTAIANADLRLLVWQGVALLGIRILQSALSLAVNVLNIRTTTDAVERLRGNLVSALYRWPRSYYAGLDQSDLHTAFMQDTGRVKQMLKSTLDSLLPTLLSLVILLSILVYLSWILTLGLLLTVPPMMWVHRRWSGRLQRAVFDFQRAVERFAKGVRFAIRAMDLTRLQAFEEGELQNQRARISDLKLRDANMAVMYAWNGQIQGVIIAFSAIFILAVGGASVINESMTLGGFFAFYFTAGLLNQRVMNLIHLLPTLTNGYQSLANLLGILDADRREPYSGTRRIEFTGHVRMQGVSFGYEQNRVLEDISFEIQPGDRICICGPNGAGKSSLLMLLLGFYRPWTGALHADGVAYEDLDVRELRRQIGSVTQSPLLYSATVGQNIAYGSPNVTAAQIEHAGRMALAHDFISELPSGYDTEVGDEAIRLSGGQRQRIALARALVKQPKLLVLDEPTTYLDAESVEKLLDSLSGLPEAPGILTVSHDPVLLRRSPLAFVLEEGVLRERQLDWSAERPSGSTALRAPGLAYEPAGLK